MIYEVLPLSAGNALRLYLSPLAGATSWRVLRRNQGAFTGPDDAGAVVVVDASTDLQILDTAGLLNGTTYSYAVFYQNAAGWADAPCLASGTPAATFQDDAPDIQELLAERLRLGLAALVARGTLLPSTGTIAVYTAPFGYSDAFALPVVSVHLDSTGPAERFVGETVAPDFKDAAGWHGTEGWFATWRLSIVAVSLNGDERIALRKAIRSIVQANLPVFAAAGVMTPDLQQTDDEKTDENAPLYFSRGSFTCLAPAFVTDTRGTIADVTLAAAVPATDTGLDFLYGG